MDYFQFLFHNGEHHPFQGPGAWCVFYHSVPQLTVSFVKAEDDNLPLATPEVTKSAETINSIFVSKLILLTTSTQTLNEYEELVQTVEMDGQCSKSKGDKKPWSPPDIHKWNSDVS